MTRRIKQHLRQAAIPLLAVAIAGCGILPDSRKIDYKSTGKAPTLEVPPDLSQIARDDRYLVPDMGGKGSATFSAYAADRSPSAQAGNSSVLPSVDNIRMERAGGQRWLVVRGAPDKLWEPVKEFWQETGFIIAIERREAGVMETDWAENRANIGDDIIRRTVGKVLDSLYSTSERDKFRTRFEPGSEPGTIDIFISHRGMQEVYTSANTNLDKDTSWQPRPSDPELEAEMLRRLMVRLGAEEKRAESVVAAAVKAEPRARLARADDGAGGLQVFERYDRAWRRVGLALDRIGFTVEDRDRAKGLYYVRYVDPEIDNRKKDEGLLSRLAFWRGGEQPKIDGKAQYRIYVRDTGNASVVEVLTAEGGVDRSESARKMLALLLQQLQ